MDKKLKALPKDFRELIQEGNVAKLKAVFDKCELDATNGDNKDVALSFSAIPDELVRWLVEKGADINKWDRYQRTPLHQHAMRFSGDLAIFLELGADTEARDQYGDTPLHLAACKSLNMVQQLLNHGASVLIQNDRGETPLEKALAAANNAGIRNLAPIAALLVKAGTPITEKMRTSVTRMGENFEFHREKFNRELLPDTDAALTQLYEIFGTQPVVQRIIHDGFSPIVLAPGTWNEQYATLWSMLVPSSGAAKTVQGEAIRITGKISDELQRNGGANWDTNYRDMLAALPQYFQTGMPLNEGQSQEARQIIKADVTMADESLTRLAELAVIWVLNNPEPIPLGAVAYLR
ncbi:ankyrin repeat domain-containing protein [Citrobacter enshiensis]|uniref:Ankyrin repeat domain-containing protein n=1 Tax=Citrobacter enshiensis TaxID=2971264 RepID=A0ABT8PSE8_9ENTR|nr:ankyrin repeat domain-containing protein [Citrobacter enshiensis]MDN8599265.1 ankyrin repeat domain-containing protein [Citrobacter enshiensis]WET41914.1 ankyrin repeat domain-containing protein [Citrobacter enshiensis]